MNRNLKRVLSLALTLIVMAVNFVIPAMAAEPITISYKDIKDYEGGLKNRNGELYFDTTASGDEQGKDTDYSPLDVWKATTTDTDRDSLNMLKTEWVRFEANVPSGGEGYYVVDINYGCAVAAGAEFVIRTDSHAIFTKLPKTGTAYTWASDSTAVPKPGTSVGYLYLNEGLNYIYVDSRSAVVNFKSLTLTPVANVDASDVTILRYATDAAQAADFTTEISQNGTEGYKVIDVADSNLTFTIPVALDGKYKVSIRGKAGAANEVTADIDGTTKSATVNNTAWKDAELGVFALEKGDHTLTLSGLKNYKLAWVTVEYEASYLTEVASTSIDEGTAKRGTDNIVVTFTDVMDPEAANDVTLTAGSGEIKTAVDVTNTVATISVLETLDYGTEYTLTLDSFKSVNDATALGELTYTFITSDEASDEGTDALDAPEVIANPDDENKFTITGTVKGSTGYGIAGRNVTLVDPDGVDVETVLSGENGAYSFELDMSANNGDAAPAAEGGEGKTIFNYTVKAEYGAEAVAQVRYLTQAVKESIMKAFDDAATAADIHAIFATHSDILGVASYSADCKTLNEHGEFYKDFTDGDGKRNNADLFMKHFIDAEGLNTVYDIPAFYQKALAIEKLNQAVTDANLKNDLTEENCAELGLLTEDSEKLKVAFSVELTREAVDKDKNDNIEYFYTFVMKDTKNKGPSTVINDPENDTAKETFAERLERLAGEWLLSINDVVATDLDLTKASSSVEEATQITIPVTFKDKQPKVTSIELVVSSATAGLVGSASVEMVKLNGSISTPKFDTDNAATATKATFTITMGDNGDVSYTEVASIGLTAPTLASENSSELHNITVSAKVTYHIVTGSEETDLTVPMTGGTVTVTVTEKPASSSNSSSSSSSFGGSSGPAPLVKEEDTEDSNKSLYFFDDMGEALWAQDMVHALVGKGVISKNDQRAFRPMDNISREEVVKMLVTVVGSHNANAKSTLADVSGDHWATSYIATAQELGIVQGNADGTFGLGQQITRQDMAVMIYRTFKLLGIDLASGNTQFADAANIAGYAQAAVSALEQQGIINGMGDGTFAPAANATRAQAAKVIYVMMEVLGV